MPELSPRQMAALMKKKEPALGVLLVFFLGPFGYFYVSILGGIIALIIEIILAVLSFITLGATGFLIVVFHVFLAILALIQINSHNRRLINGL